MARQRGPVLNSFSVAALASIALLAAGCGPKPPTPTVNASMTQVIAPQTQTIWDITNRAINAKGDGLDGSKISSTEWVKVEKAALRLSRRAHVLAESRGIVAAGDDEIIMGGDAAGAPSGIGHTWDAASAKQVQAFIDAKPALFAERARILARSADTMVWAARTKDARALHRETSGMDEVCDGCHVTFWGTDENPPFPD